MFDILVTEICFVNLMSCLLSSNNSMSLIKNAKHYVLNTLDFKPVPYWIVYPRPYRYELLEG